MYRYLREVYWLNDMERDIEDFVSKCPNYQQVKVEHQKLGGITEEIDIPTWKWMWSIWISSQGYLVLADSMTPYG